MLYNTSIALFLSLSSFVLAASSCDINDYSHYKGLKYNRDTMRFSDEYKTEYKSTFPGVNQIAVIDRCFERHNEIVEEPKKSAGVDVLYIQLEGDGKVYSFSCNELPKDKAICAKYHGN